MKIGTTIFLIAVALIVLGFLSSAYLHLKSDLQDAAEMLNATIEELQQTRMKLEALQAQYTELSSRYEALQKENRDLLRVIQSVEAENALLREQLDKISTETASAPLALTEAESTQVQALDGGSIAGWETDKQIEGMAASAALAIGFLSVITVSFLGVRRLWRHTDRHIIARGRLQTRERRHLGNSHGGEHGTVSVSVTRAELFNLIRRRRASAKPAL